MYEAIHFEGNPQECGHVVTTACVRPDGQRHILRYAAERVVGNGSFGVVFQATCVETRETVAIKRVLQDKRFKNRELQIMRLLDHPNVVQLKHSFFSTADRDDVYLNLVLEYVPDTVYRIIKHYAKRNQVRCPPRPNPGAPTRRTSTDRCGHSRASRLLDSTRCLRRTRSTRGLWPGAGGAWCSVARGLSVRSVGTLAGEGRNGARGASRPLVPRPGAPVTPVLTRCLLCPPARGSGAQRMPHVYVKVYMFQVFCALSHIHALGVCHR